MLKACRRWDLSKGVPNKWSWDYSMSFCSILTSLLGAELSSGRQRGYRHRREKSVEYSFSKLPLVGIVQTHGRAVVLMALKGNVGQDAGKSSTLSFWKCQAMLNVCADMDRNQRSRNKWPQFNISFRWQSPERGARSGFFAQPQGALPSFQVAS